MTENVTPELLKAFSDAFNLAALADLLYWLPLDFILAFLILESRRRLLAGSLAFLAALLLIASASHPTYPACFARPLRA